MKLPNVSQFLTFRNVVGGDKIKSICDLNAWFGPSQVHLFPCLFSSIHYSEIIRLTEMDQPAPSSTSVTKSIFANSTMFAFFASP